MTLKARMTMDIIDFLLTRRSTPAVFLQEPVPNQEELNTILSVAVTAPDHGGIRPWRFLTIRGEARLKLGDAFAMAAKQQNPEFGDQQLEAIRQKPLRSPLIIAVIANIVEHPKVPQCEQMLSAGVAAYNIELAACALGFGATWLTGPYTNKEPLTQALGLSENEQIIGFIYLGTPSAAAAKAWEKALARPKAADITQEWA